MVLNINFKFIYLIVLFNVIFLILLYTLQGFPIGVIEAFSVSLQVNLSVKSLMFKS